MRGNPDASLMTGERGEKRKGEVRGKWEREKKKKADKGRGTKRGRGEERGERRGEGREESGG